MPVLDNPRHERFAQELAKGKTATDAYFEASGTKNRRYASELGLRPDISGRVSELLTARENIHAQATAQAIQAAGLTKEWVIEQLRRNASLAMGDELAKVKMLPKGLTTPIEVEISMRDATAANRALELLGKELGMFVERSENTNVNYEVSDEPLTDDQWAEQHATAH